VTRFTSIEAEESVLLRSWPGAEKVIPSQGFEASSASPWQGMIPMSSGVQRYLFNCYDSMNF